MSMIYPPDKTLAAFCATDHDLLHHLQTPMRGGGYLYATNGHIAVRIPDDPAVQADHPPFPSLLELFGRTTKDSDWQAAPCINPTDYRHCDECLGTGSVRSCDCCDGQGQFERRGYWHECEPCNASGTVSAEPEAAGARSCPVCLGSGIHHHDGVDIGCAHYAARYLWLIGTHFLGAEIAPRPFPKDGDQPNPAFWRAGDALGLLMPMRRP